MKSRNMSCIFVFSLLAIPIIVAMILFYMGKGYPGLAHMAAAPLAGGVCGFLVARRTR